MDNRPTFPPIDMCQMALELGRVAPEHKPFMDTVIDAVKAAQKVAAPFDLIKSYANLETEQPELRVPQHLMLTAVTQSDNPEDQHIAMALWIPSTSEMAKRVNRYYKRPADLDISKPFHWVVLARHDAEQFIFSHRLAVVPDVMTDTVMQFAEYTGAASGQKPDERDEQLATSAMITMSAVLHIERELAPGQEDSGRTESKLEAVLVNCGTEPEFKNVQHAFGPISDKTWNMHVIMERDFDD